MPPAFLALFLLALASVSAAPFEGRINLQRATVPDAPHDLIYRVKGDKNRVEVFRLEARTIVAQPLHDRLFLPSSTYRKVETWP